MLHLARQDQPYRIALAALVGLAVVTAAVLAVRGPAFTRGDAGTEVIAAPPRISLADPAAPHAGPGADAARLDDLRRIEATLATYEGFTGAYPSTGGKIVTVCSALAVPACGLWAFDPHMLASDGTTPYHYRSDGKTFTVYARADAAIDDAPCAGTLPPGHDAGSTLCLTGRATPAR